LKKDMDALAQVEFVIMEYLLARGYKLEKDQVAGDAKWSFEVAIESSYKEKVIYVYLWEENSDSDCRTVRTYTLFENTTKTTKEMFSSAVEYFEAEKKKIISK